MSRSFLIHCFVLGAICFGSCAIGAEWGDLTGRFVVEGQVAPALILQQTAKPCGVPAADDSVMVDAENRLQNCFIYLRSKPNAVAPRYKATAENDVLLELKNCYFTPHVLAMRTSQTLVVRNAETFNISVQLLTTLHPSVHLPLLVDSEIEVHFREQESLPIRTDCTVKPFFRAWVLVRDDPYAAVSAADGSFAIRDLPAGEELEFQLWHERVGYLKGVPTGMGPTNARGRLTVRIQPGENALGTIAVPAKLLN